MAYLDFSPEGAAMSCRAGGLGDDPRLDALGSATRAAWRGTLSPAEAKAFVAAGLRQDQLAELVASIGLRSLSAGHPA